VTYSVAVILKSVQEFGSCSYFLIKYEQRNTLYILIIWIPSKDAPLMSMHTGCIYVEMRANTYTRAFPNITSGSMHVPSHLVKLRIPPYCYLWSCNETYLELHTVSPRYLSAPNLPFLISIQLFFNTIASLTTVSFFHPSVNFLITWYF
jgi:hypothetical protein